MGNKLGVFGGAFDPPHTGHVNIAVNAARLLNLDKTLIIPTGKSPHKTESATPYADRLEMARLAFSEYNNFEISDIENIENKPGKSYTIDTLRGLKTLYPDSLMYLIIGGDMLTSFDKWRGYAEILSLCRVAAAAREYNYNELEPYAEKFGIILLKIPVVTFSSSKFRENPDAELLPPLVYDYIKKRGLYHNRTD